MMADLIVKGKTIKLLKKTRNKENMENILMTTE